MFHVCTPLPCANVYEIYILESLNIKTARGPDNIAATFSKMLADKIATYEELLRSLFRGIEEELTISIYWPMPTKLQYFS